VWGLVGGLLVANALAAGLSLGFLWRLARFRLRLERGFLRYLARESLPLALTNVFILVYFRVDMVMLQLMGRGYAEIGWYAAAVRVIDAVAVVPALVSGAALPVLSGLARDDRQGFGRLYRQAQRLLIVLGLPAAVGLWAVREQVAVLVYGPRFAPTGLAFCWLAPALALLFLNFLQLGALTALGRQRLCAWSTGMCVVVNVGLNLWLIPAYGFQGAAAATLFTELALFAMCAWFLRAEAGLRQTAAQALRPMAAVGVMAVGLSFTRGLPLPIIIATAAALYGGALLVFRGLTVEELARLRSMLLRRDA
jgi:O-antigen/teichoic acid export membrane protein